MLCVGFVGLHCKQKRLLDTSIVMLFVGTQWSAPFQAVHSVSPSIPKFLERIDYFFVIQSWSAVTQHIWISAHLVTPLLLMAIVSFWRNTIVFLQQQQLVGSHLVLIFLLCLFCGVFICNPSVTGTSVSNLELINCCFQFLRIKQQQVTICTSLLPLHILTALDLHQELAFFQWALCSFDTSCHLLF